MLSHRNGLLAAFMLRFYLACRETLRTRESPLGSRPCRRFGLHNPRVRVRVCDASRRDNLEVKLILIKVAGFLFAL
jgi:hypothetical protein